MSKVKFKPGRYKNIQRDSRPIVEVLAVCSTRVLHSWLKISYVHYPGDAQNYRYAWIRTAPNKAPFRARIETSMSVEVCFIPGGYLSAVFTT